MDNSLLGNVNRTVICCIVFVDIVEYSKKTTAKQLAIKGWFNDIISQPLKNVALEDRIVLDTGDGAALCFLGDPEEALFAANSVRVAVIESNYPELALRIGINLGPVKVVKDINGQHNIVGDGINVAQRVMAFSEPNQILVSRSYFEVVSRLAEEYTDAFHYRGMRQDKHVREHEVYEFNFVAAGRSSPPEVKPKTETALNYKTNVLTKPAEHAQSVSFDENTLADIAARLAEYLGPLARLIVKKTATRSSDLAQLCSLLAANIPVETQKAAFLSRVLEFSGTVSGAPNAGLASEERLAESTSVVKQAPVTQELGADSLAFAEQLFAKYIGPMATILVKRAARISRNSDELFQELAKNLDNESQRRAFLAESERSRSSD